jgi:pSer/pThr/pTyr-binding forkhead associated (FHA) protein
MMKIRLNLIESRLRVLIEEWIVPFQTDGFQSKLAHQLVESMQEHIQTDNLGQAVAPYQYTIQLHPELVDELRGSDILEHLPEALEESARLGGMVFLRRPILRLQPDPALTLEDIHVLAQSEQASPGNTAALSLKKKSEEPDDLAKLTVSAYLIVNGEKIFTLNRSATNIGRRSDNHLVINDPRVSRVHAQIRLSRGQFVIFDLNSSGGTSINGQRVHQHVLKPGDVISLSGIALIYGEEPKPGEGSSDTTRIATSDPPPSEEIG